MVATISALGNYGMAGDMEIFWGNHGYSCRIQRLQFASQFAFICTRVGYTLGFAPAKGRRGGTRAAGTRAGNSENRGADYGTRDGTRGRARGDAREIAAYGEKLSTRARARARGAGIRGEIEHARGARLSPAAGFLRQFRGNSAATSGRPVCGDDEQLIEQLQMNR